MQFSNKGYHFGASWKGHNTVRVYSLHKQNTFVEIAHERPVLNFAFDKFGVYLATSDGHKIKVFYFRDFSVPIASFEEAASIMMFDVNGSNIVIAHKDRLKLLSL